jgi:hypothetical protein
MIGTGARKKYIKYSQNPRCFILLMEEHESVARCGFLFMYFPYFEKKNKSWLMSSPHCVCL